MKKLLCLPAKRHALLGKSVITLFYENSTGRAFRSKLASKFMGAAPPYCASDRAWEGRDLDRHCQNHRSMATDILIMRTVIRCAA
jgi:aspartate carbamoyltransferase catalytic subunit